MPQDASEGATNELPPDDDATPGATAERFGPTADEPSLPALVTVDWLPSRCPVPWRRPFAAAAWLVQMAAGTAAIVLLLAIVAAVPVVNFYALGVLLEASARVSRGRVRDGFWLWGAAPRLGVILLAGWAFLLPVRLLASMASDAAVIDPSAPATEGLRVATVVAAAVVAGHLLLTLARGGRLRHFLWPFGNLWWAVRGGLGRDWYRQASHELAALLAWLEVPRLWSMGLRGFLGALAWLAIPTAMYLAARRPDDPGMLITLLGFFPLVHVLCRLPFLQVRFARENRLRAYLAHRDTRRLFGYAPWAWLVAVVVLYVLTLPLYLTKVVLPPRDAVWLTTILYILPIFPTKIALGWAYGRAVRRREAGKPRSRWWSRWPARLLMTALVGVYTFVLFFTQYISEHGRAALFEQHAFLLPWPF